MNLTLSMESLKHVFSFPFYDPKWKEKFLIGSLLAFGGTVIPIVPWVAMLGYAARMIRAGARSEDAAVLPEWDNWGDLFIDGLRLLGVSLILTLPAIVVLGFGSLIYGFGIAAMQTPGHVEPNPQSVSGFLIGLLVFFLSMGIGVLLYLLGSLALSPAGTHVAYQQRFSALFEVGAWWKIFRANLGGFLVTLFVLFGLSFAMTFATQILYMTIILCLFIPLAIAPMYFYILVVFGRLSGQAYGEGLEKV